MIAGLSSYNDRRQITISFTDFHTEACCDFVTVYQCTDIACSAKQFLGELYGTYSSPQNLTSTTGYILVHFTSNHAIQYPGFTASWTSAAAPIPVPAMVNVSHLFAHVECVEYETSCLFPVCFCTFYSVQ
jgi:hypothetical protein